MSNERIDLTQFEGVPKGPWRWKETADYGSIKPWNMPRDLVNDEGELIIEANLDVSMEEVDDLLAMSPDLLAELKRCYEEIDDLKRQYQSCNEALIETTNWNVRMVEAIDSGKMSAIKRVRNS